MLKVYPDIQAKGGEILVVSFTPPVSVAAYVRESGLPFAIVSDPTLAAYRGFHLERTSVAGFLKPRVVWRYLKRMFQGWKPKKPGEGEDVMQLGGDFVLDARQRLVYSHPSRDATDRPTPAELVAAVEKAAES